MQRPENTLTRHGGTCARVCAPSLRDRLGDRVLPVDDAVALEWGRITARAELAGRPVTVIDGLIAATAIVHGLAVVTRNSSDMARTGAPIVDPWEPR